MSKYSENMPPDIQGAIGWAYEKIKPDSTLIDFGCSTGYFGSFIKEHKKCRVYGVEISDDRKEAEKVLDGVYSFDLDGDWPEKIYEHTYDHVLFGDVLEHLKDPSLVLSKAKKLLKPGGSILVSVPNIAHMSIRLELLGGNFVYEPMGILDNTHLQYFTLSTFFDCARRAKMHAELVDFTPNDIPKQIIEKRLKKLGLKADTVFWKTLQTVEARAYQFKFVLTSAKEGEDATNKVSVSELTKPLQYRDDIIDHYKMQLENLDKHSVEQSKLIDHFKITAERLEHELAVARKPLAYRVSHSVKTRTGRILSKVRSLKGRK